MIVFHLLCSIKPSLYEMFSNQGTLGKSNPVQGSDDQVQVRFGGSSNANEGYIEVNYKGQGWKGVCDDSFDLNDAHVFCRMAGYTEGAETAYTRSKPFGYGSSGNVLALDNLACKGSEQSVVDCVHAGWNKENCNNKEWAGVKCKGTKSAVSDLYLSSWLEIKILTNPFTLGPIKHWN